MLSSAIRTSTRRSRAIAASSSSSSGGGGSSTAAAAQRAAGRYCPHGAARRKLCTAPAEVEVADYVVVGAGPVGASTAWFLSEHEMAEDKSIVLIHDPTDRGAHEDWSRLARLSFDGPRDEMDLSRHAVGLLDLVDEVRSYQSGAPVVPMRPGMLFLASPGTPMAQTCTHGESYGDEEFVRRSPDELADLYPGNEFNLPPETLCWTHPTGLCVSPPTQRSMRYEHGSIRCMRRV